MIRAAWSLWLVSCLFGANIAHASHVFVLELDPTASGLFPEMGDSESLSGEIQVEIAELPLASGATNFDIIRIEVQAGPTLGFALDSTLANPGLGVLSASGEFLIPTLFLEVQNFFITPVAVPDVTGQVEFTPTGDGIRELWSEFQFDAGGSVGRVDVVVHARVPEPHLAVLLATLTAFGLWRTRQP